MNTASPSSNVVSTFFVRMTGLFTGAPREKSPEEIQAALKREQDSHIALGHTLDKIKEAKENKGKPYILFSKLAERALQSDLHGKEVGKRSTLLDGTLYEGTETLLSMVPRGEMHDTMRNEFLHLVKLNRGIADLLPKYLDRFEDKNGHLDTLFLDDVMAVAPMQIKEGVSLSGDYYTGGMFEYGAKYYHCARREADGHISYVVSNYFENATALMKATRDSDLELDKRDIEPFIRATAKQLKI